MQNISYPINTINDTNNVTNGNSYCKAIEVTPTISNPSKPMDCKCNDTPMYGKTSGWGVVSDIHNKIKIYGCR